MTPSEVLDRHVDLVTRLDDHRFQEIMVECYKLAWWDTSTGTNDPTSGVAQYLTNKLGQGVRGAPNYQVSKDMVQLLTHAAHSLDSEDFIDVSLAPTPTGFVHFDTPVLLKDVRGATLKAHYLLWNHVDNSELSGPSMCLTWFHDALDPDDAEAAFNDSSWGHAEEAKQILGRWRWIGADLVATGFKLGEEIISPSEELRTRIVLENGEAFEGTNMVRIAHALWLMLEQTITVVREESTDRAVARRAKRKNLPAGVTVVQLRRAEYVGEKPEGHSDVVWKHRWIVRGHWRWQVCGPNHKLAQETAPGVFRARIWIAPFIKGPEGAELIVTEKINVLNR